MKPITIKYRPVSFIPIYRTASGMYPQNWGDITPAQLIAISCLYKNRISDLLFLKRMTNLPMHVLKRTDDYERFKLMECFEFIADRRPFHEFIIRKISIRNAPVIKHLFLDLKLVSPNPKLKDMTFGQFIFSDTWFSIYQESQKEEDLNKFIAALYLNKGEKFEEWIIEQRHKHIGGLDRNTREAIAINWQLIHEWLALAYPLIFQKRDEIKRIEPLPESDGKPKSDTNVWIKLFQNFVGDDILHDDIWASKPINTIFTYMTRKYKENARRKK